MLVAADSLGAAQVMLDKAVAYAKERRQFGRVIGSFQAVKHLCAEMVAELEPCRSLVWYAAYAFDAAPQEASLMAAHAKALGWTKRAQIVVSREAPLAARAKVSSAIVAIFARRVTPSRVHSR